jgi:hypothetical protein
MMDRERTGVEIVWETLEDLIYSAVAQTMWSQANMHGLLWGSVYLIGALAGLKHGLENVGEEEIEATREQYARDMRTEAAKRVGGWAEQATVLEEISEKAAKLLLDVLNSPKGKVMCMPSPRKARGN